jgi:Arylsulfotransferase (ASST)
MKIRITLFFAALLFISYSCKNDNAKEPITEKVEIRQWNPEDTRTITGASSKRGLIKKTDKATPGYVLFSPGNSTQSYLMNMDGDVVHSWTGELSTLLHGYLLKNGHLIRLERDDDFPTFAAGGQAGRIREYDWDGNMVWDFESANENELTHHDIEILPNGNILAIAYEVKTPEEAIEAGRDPKHTAKAGIWPDKIIEIKPTKPSGGEIVWEWHMWDHLIQDIDSTKNNFGIVAEHPEKININIHAEGGPPMSEEQIAGMKKMGFATSNATVDNQTSDISHVNAISYNPELDQIVISIPHFSEIYIIDHNTTTEEAKGIAGDLLYRWGNPANYGKGTMEDQKLFGQHDIKWVPKGYPGYGNLTVFNNDILNPNNKLPSVFAALMSPNPDPQVSIADIGNYSAVYEFTPSTYKDGSYMLNEDGTYGPSEPTWTYTAPDKYSMYSAFISGAQRLKNGNTLVTSGAKGRFIEVTPKKEIVWEYWNPYTYNYKLPDGSPAQPTGPFIYGQFRSTHFTPDFPAFAGKDLKPMSPQPEPSIFKMPPPPTTKDSIN